MKKRTTLYVAAGMACVLFCCGAVNSNAAVASWDASSGLTPDQVGFEVVDSGGSSLLLSGGVLTMSSTAPAETMYYGHREPNTTLEMPDVFEAAFTMRFVSGSNNNVGRTTAAVFVTTGVNIGLSLWFDQDEVFLGNTWNAKGPSVAVDTDDSFHDYLLKVEGEAITVYQDGSPVLTGSTYYHSSAHGVNERVLFGDISIRENGVSEWKNFSHNAIPEPASLGLVALCSGGIFFVRRFFIV